MKLKLHNFRCHIDSSFDFRDTGLLLISAKRGRGKTTILNAILFALYGELKKPRTFGTSSCFVNLEMAIKGKIYKIHRKSGPKKFTLSIYDPKKKITQNYEGNDAQNVLNTNFLNYHEFLASSYIKQKENNSILSLTPMEQLNFIKKLALDEKIGLYKEKIKTLVKERLEYMETVKRNMLSSKEQFTELEKQKAKYKDYPKKNPLDEQFDDIETLTTSISNITEEISELKTQRNELSERIENINDTKEIIKENEKKKVALETELKTLTKRLEKYNDLLSEEDVKSIEDESEELSSLLSTIKLKKKYDDDILSFEEEEKEYFEDIQNKLQDISNQLITEEEYDELVSRKEQVVQNEKEVDRIKTLKTPATKKLSNIIPQICEILSEEITLSSEYLKRSIILLKNKATFTQNSIKENDQNIDELKEIISKGDIYVCPSCESSLQFCDNELIVSSGEIKDISKIEKKLASLLENKNVLNKTLTKINNLIRTIEDNIENFSLEIPQFDDVEFSDEDEEKINSYKTIKNQHQQYTNIIEKHILSNILSNKKKKLNDMKNKLPKDFESDETEESINEKINEKTQITTEYYRRNTEMVSLKRDVENCKKKIEKFNNTNKNISEENIDDIYKEIKDIDENIENKGNKLREYEILALEYGKYDLYKSFIDNLNIWKSRFEDNKKEYENSSKKYSSALALKEKSAQAEILALESIISTINEYAKFYLDQMFEDDPIIVEIENTKETKKDVVMKMNTKIIYKGNVYDDITQLSGGEKDTVSLAFILAVNDMVNSPILMLDECLSSLDAETNSEIIELLKDNAGDKCILTISHEAVKGIFDEVYFLEELKSDILYEDE